MSRVVVLSLGKGSLATGFASVVLEVHEPTHARSLKLHASLPPAPDLLTLYREWQVFHSAYYLSYRRGIQIIDEADVVHFSEKDFEQVCRQLPDRLNAWLDCEEFRDVDRQLRTRLNPMEEIQVTIETNDDAVRRLPWCLWRFFADFPHAEVELSDQDYQRAPLNGSAATAGVKILVILGDSTGINVQEDCKAIRAVPHAQTEFLVEPRATEVRDRLWSQGWDILFFAGHSSSQDDTGRIYLNATESLTIAELRPSLRTAIANGLKLAIFNSCDGLKLARDLADLHIPATIVMREPVPDRVAQAFLQYFLPAFANGASLHRAFRQAREQLHVWQKEFPCAAWLPTLTRNPAEDPPTWAQLKNKQQRQKRQRTKTSSAKVLRTILVLSLMSTLLVVGVRQLGWLQNWELQAYDQMLRWRSDEEPDSRLLIVKITDEDLNTLNLPEQKERDKISLSDQQSHKASLSDEALELLLRKLESFQPKAIGLDLYQDYEIDARFPKLKDRLREDENLFGICRLDPLDPADPKNSGKNSIRKSPDISAARNGFNDFPSPNNGDNGRLRRQLLFMDVVPKSLCTADFSLSFKLAMHYLQGLGINSEVTPDKNIRIGSVLFRRLNHSVGAYKKADTMGSQIMINYRSYKGSISNLTQSMTLTDILKDRIADEKLDDLKGRIILIGADHYFSQKDDSYLTPFSLNESQEQKVPGVLLQAQMVSQILSAVLDGRPLLQPLMWWNELIWIGSLSVVSGVLLLRMRSVLHLLKIEGVLLFFLCSISGVLFAQGVWVPLIPSILVILLTSSSIFVYVQTSVR